MAIVKQNLKRLNEMVSQMTAEGMLDAQFAEIQKLQDSEEELSFTIDMIELYCKEGLKTIQAMTHYMEEPVVDFGEVDLYVIKIKGTSLYMGTQQVTLACIEFRQDIADKERCIRTLEKISHEFNRVSAMFKDLVKAIHVELQKLITYLHIPPGMGILDATEFKNLQTSLEDDPAFLVDIIEESCIECCKTIQEMNNYLYQPVVDFCKVDVCVHKIKGPCLYIGARRVILACVGFRQALDEKDKERLGGGFLLITPNYTDEILILSATAYRRVSMGSIILAIFWSFCLEVHVGAKSPVLM
ncbi:hypothetical protein IFM89_035767 [Coptis chinensis]|uniref:Histidine-containing phosphotransfer protein n=1 Tax=Coptis chinensis TaxID=261450 RepID=A0A835HAM7_9MAGN|nr:hypothetical protein IFM89_035767 [Coptis chinensis]